MGIYHFNRGKDELIDLNLNEQQEKVSTFINNQLSANNLAIFIGSGCSTGAIPLMSTTMKKILEENDLVLYYVKIFLDSREIKEFVKYLEARENKITQETERKSIDIIKKIYTMKNLKI
ncbi:hypothetical protein M4L90_07900 [Staphylococcus equorum]|uniref:SIR2-like domain-containing protein n=1 Tax=Staphylococcus equorum TaxID=246432 RepID=A0A9X4L4U5_9STAP|nr:hypothetical protein [Staphylococcus equorum]MDG0819819.1 hypothetical protein [Staphylococcus equorum]MDG0840460.1 hypothetical protein [Staphylococcus equorum]MDG0846143.1 hypothetical protein [Staphylococcus equorum]